MRSQNLRPNLISNFQILPSHQDEDFSFFFLLYVFRNFMKIPEHKLFRTQLTDPRRRSVQGKSRNSDTENRKYREIPVHRSEPVVVPTRNCYYKGKIYSLWFSVLPMNSYNLRNTFRTKFIHILLFCKRTEVNISPRF